MDKAGISSKIKEKLEELYVYLGGKKGIAVRAIGYPAIIYTSYKFDGSYHAGAIIDLLCECWHNMIYNWKLESVKTI